ncbi:uncharacterized protein TA11670 [Theileria annulata]|uniref:Uncharacterized protein n=1 Tax=Theileria annulata TaxID=5874 RepID=Q4UDL8_THEAN|nr:uncharacterized protein TA11670 [Theileria annulata]CAI74821.1 hypothetical protein TA11670 [Theileria annulata]|eukprot:XP_952553.1 hypothetical protein TA11670 [Theileria annulata]
MIILTRLIHVESYFVNRSSSSHISNLCKFMKQERRFIRFPRLFEKQNPEIVSQDVLNLHDQNTGFTNFLKTMDSMVSNKELTLKSFISLIEKFEPSITEDNEHLGLVLENYSTETLLLMMDSITLFNQSRVSKNFNVFLNNLSTILSKRNLIEYENDTFFMKKINYLFSIINRIKHKSEADKAIIESINKQIRGKVDFFIEKGKFTDLFRLSSYTLDPKSIYTIVYCILFKLDKFKHSDYGNLPKFLFDFKIHDEVLLSRIINHASTSPSTIFEEESFGKFIRNLCLFDQVYDSKEISFRPLVVYLQTLGNKLDLYDKRELYFILSSIPNQTNFDKLGRKQHKTLVDQILVKIGVLSEDNSYKTIAHLDNHQLISLIKYLNKVEYVHNSVECDNIKSLLLNEQGNMEMTRGDLSQNELGLLSNEFAKSLSERFLKEIPQNSKFSDLSDTFKNLEVLESLLFVLNRLIISGVDKFYTDSLLLSFKSLLVLMADNMTQNPNILEFLRNVSKLNMEIVTEISGHMYKFCSPDDLRVFEKGFRFKLLYLRKNPDPLEYSETNNEFRSFEVLKDKISRENFELILKVLDLIQRYCSLAEELKEFGQYMSEFEESFDKFCKMGCEFLGKKPTLFTIKSSNLIANIARNIKFKPKIDEMINFKGRDLKIPQLFGVFMYRIKTTNTSSEDLKGLEETVNQISGKLEELVKILEETFTKRVCIYEPGDNREIRKTNPWMNEKGLKLLFKDPNEPFDMFLYEKCPEIDHLFTLEKYKYRIEDESGEEKGVSSLHELKMELVEISKQITEEEMKLKWRGNDNELMKELISDLGSKVRRVVLEVEMCRPISRDHYLPKTHTKELVKLSLNRFWNQNDKFENFLKK